MKGGLRMLALAACAAATSCVSYVRFRSDEPVPAAALDALAAGRDDLARCLQALGAPVEVREYRGDGMALIYSWQDENRWGFEFSMPLQDYVSANFEYDLGSLDRPGCVLLFGPDLVLESVRRGTLGAVLPTRTRPAAHDG